MVVFRGARRTTNLVALFPRFTSTICRWLFDVLVSCLNAIPPKVGIEETLDAKIIPTFAPLVGFVRAHPAIPRQLRVPPWNSRKRFPPVRPPNSLDLYIPTVTFLLRIPFSPARCLRGFSPAARCESFRHVRCPQVHPSARVLPRMMPDIPFHCSNVQINSYVTAGRRVSFPLLYRRPSPNPLSNKCPVPSPDLKFFRYSPAVKILGCDPHCSCPM